MVCQCCEMGSRDTYCDDNNVVLLCLCDPVMLLVTYKEPDAVCMQ